MPGTYIFKPIEANLTRDTNLITQMNPYCTFQVNESTLQSEICKKGGKHPHWDDIITIPIPNDSSAQVLVQVKDKDRILPDDDIGSFVMDLHEVQDKGQLSKWFPLNYNGANAGEMLMEVIYTPGASPMERMNEKTSMASTTSMEKKEPSAVFVEQKQEIEPHSFKKEVEATEIRHKTKEIEVTEPVTVTKHVPVTEPVHVKKQVDVTEPEVVMKEVEVMEPQLVTKTIQVVEDVPVKRQVEAVEMKTTQQEFDTVEPRTFDKEVEVTEYVPVKKEVEVTEPVTVKKNVECVEPIVTTTTTTKEIPQPVVVNQETSTTVGPASVVDEKTRTMKEEAKMTNIKEERRESEMETIEKRIGEYQLESPPVEGGTGMESEVTKVTESFDEKEKRWKKDL